MENNKTKMEQKLVYTSQAYNTLFQKLKRAKEREKILKEKVREIWALLSKTK